MKAVQINQYGGAETLQLVDVEKPTPAANEVLIRVKATAVNLVDVKIRAGYVQQMIPVQFPLTPGWETAGVVEAVGSAVTRFKAGDEVYAMLPFHNNGAYADYVCADENVVALKPKTISFTQAAAVPMVAGAAYTVLYKFAHIKPGQNVLIQGAGGGVGSYAVQMAKAAGAHVIGTASGDDIPRLKALGADEVIDYQTTDFTKVVHDVDVVIDNVGGETLEKSYGVLKKGGQLLCLSMPPSEEKAKAYGIQAAFVFTQPDPAMLDTIATWIDEGKLKPGLIETMPLQKAAKAHQALENRTASAKVVFEM